MSNLNDLDPGVPTNQATYAEVLSELRNLKALVKSILLVSFEPNGRLKTGALTGLAADSIGSEELKPNAVTETELADGSVTQDKVAAGAIIAAHLAAESVTEDAYGPASIPQDAFKDNTIKMSHLAERVLAAQLGSHLTDDTLRAVTQWALGNACVTDRAVNDVGYNKLTGGDNGQILFKNAGAWQAVSVSGSGDLTFDALTGLFKLGQIVKCAVLGDSRSRGTDGGTALATTWNLRTIGELHDPDGIATISSNRIKLLEGKYLVAVRSPVNGAIGLHQARLMDYTNTQPVLWGSSESTPSANDGGASWIFGAVEVTDPDTEYTIEHYTTNGVATVGLGAAASSGNTPAYGSHEELYTIAFIVKYA